MTPTGCKAPKGRHVRNLHHSNVITSTQISSNVDFNTESDRKFHNDPIQGIVRDLFHFICTSHDLATLSEDQILRCGAPQESSGSYSFEVRIKNGQISEPAKTERKVKALTSDLHAVARRFYRC